MKAAKGQFPESFKRAEARWVVAAKAMIAAGASDKTMEVVGKIVEGAMTKGNKQEAIGLLEAVDSNTRREVAATFSIFNQFTEQVMMVCASVAVEQGDGYAQKSDQGLTGTLNLGDGDETEPQDPSDIHVGAATQKVLGMSQTPPPEVQFIAALIKSMGFPVEVVGPGDDLQDGLEPLQDQYAEPDADPIKELARRLDRMPGKKIRLPSKPLPEC